MSGYQSQGSGGRGGGVTQRHKNLVNMNAALMASAQGDWIRAEEILRGLVAVNPDDFVVCHSFWLAVCPLECACVVITRGPWDRPLAPTPLRHQWVSPSAVVLFWKPPPSSSTDPYPNFVGRKQSRRRIVEPGKT